MVKGELFLVGWVKHSQKLSLYSPDLFIYFTISCLPFVKFINYIVLDYMNIIKSSTRYRLCFPKFYIYRINNEPLCYWEGEVKKRKKKKRKGRRVFFASWHEYVTCTAPPSLTGAWIAISHLSFEPSVNIMYLTTVSTREILHVTYM